MCSLLLVILTAQFENSLGRVTASSVHNPRQIIDIKRTPSTEQEDAKAREVRHFKEILLDIEKVIIPLWI